MMHVAILGVGNVAHALAGLLGARPEMRVTLWGRRCVAQHEVAICVYGQTGIYALGAATMMPKLRDALQDAEFVVIAVPAHMRSVVIAQEPEMLDKCTFLISWEGMGWFREELAHIGITRPIAVGLQRSPILCRIRSFGQSVELFGVRSCVVAAPVNPACRAVAGKLLSSLLPFNFLIAPHYECVSLSPSNPLIHPARIYSFSLEGDSEKTGTRFYGDWDNAASTILLSLHREISQLRDRMQLPRRYLSTLNDGSPTKSASDLTSEYRKLDCLAELQLPLRFTPRGNKLDSSHRFFLEDIGEGLAYIAGLAYKNRVNTPTVDTILRWYKSEHSIQSRRHV